MSETYIIRKVREKGVEVHMFLTGDGWCLYCDEHGRTCTWEKQKDALSFLPYPSNWCEECSRE